MRNSPFAILPWLAIVSAVLFLAPLHNAVCQELASLHSAEGTVERLPNGTQSWESAEKGTLFYEGDSIRTGPASRAALVLTEGGVLRLGAQSSMRLTKPGGTPTLKVSQGRGYLFSREPRNRPRIETPVVSAAIRGTEVSFELLPLNEVRFSVLDGSVALSSEQNTQVRDRVISEGFRATVSSSDFSEERIVSFGDSVQWLLRYPVLFSSTDLLNETQQQELDSLRGLSSAAIAKSAASSVVRAVRLHQLGEHTSAFSILKSVSPSNAQESALKAMSALSVGETAASDSLLTAGSASTSALAVAIAAAKQFTIEGEIASRETELLQESLFGRYILALSNQADGDIESALSIAQEALAVEPSSEILRLYVAELLLADNQAERALEMLESAAMPEAFSASAETLQGYARTLRSDFSEAENLFASVLEQKPESSEAHLGLALSQVYEGNFEGAKKSLELASAMSPERGLYRSYLGKLYFENEQNELAYNEYQQALQLDPNDPTPYYYRSFIHRSKNAPVKALADLEEAIERNENRGVYRSRFLLDQDKAARSANVGRVYRDLRFEELAELEAARSLNTSYLDHSAHLLLSESFTTFETIDAQLGSERIAQVLSPLSFNALRGTSSPLSLNEYSSLFERDAVRTQVSTVFNSDSELFDSEAEVAIRQGRYGGYLSYRGAHAGSPDRVDSLDSSEDTEAPGDFSRTHNIEATLRADVTEDDHLLVFGSFSNFESSIGEDSIRPEEASVTLSYTKDLDQSGRAIAQARYLKRRGPASSLQRRDDALIETVLNEESLSDFSSLLLESETKSVADSFQGVLQYIREGSNLRVISGYEYGFGSSEADELALVLDNTGGAFDSVLLEQDRVASSDLDQNIHAHTLYTYTSYQLFPSLRLEAGLNAAFVDYETSLSEPFVDDKNSRQKLNPKVGFFYERDNLLTVRGSYFETLARSINLDETSLEPILVGGINQRFTDLPGDHSENLAAAIDVKLRETGSYIGAGWLKREISRVNSATPEVFSFDFDTLSESYEVLAVAEAVEDIDVTEVNAYFHQIVSEQLIASLTYDYFDTETAGLSDVESNILRSRVGAFSSTQVYGFLEGAWRNQERSNSLFAPDGSESFWVFDATLGYRLPNLSGAVEVEFQNIFDEDFFYDNLAGFEEFVRPGFAFELRTSVNF